MGSHNEIFYITVIGMQPATWGDTPLYTFSTLEDLSFTSALLPRFQRPRVPKVITSFPARAFFHQPMPLFSLCWGLCCEEGFKFGSVYKGRSREVRVKMTPRVRNKESNNGQRQRIWQKAAFRRRKRRRGKGGRRRKGRKWEEVEGEEEEKKPYNLKSKGVKVVFGDHFLQCMCYSKMLIKHINFLNTII